MVGTVNRNRNLLLLAQQMGWRAAPGGDFSFATKLQETFPVTARR